MNTVGIFRSITDADMARIRLSAHGIDSIIADEAFATAGYGGFVAELRLQVNDADLDKARAILADDSLVDLPEDFDVGGREDEMNDEFINKDLNITIERLSRKIDNVTIVIVACLIFIFLFIAMRMPRPQTPSRWDQVTDAVERLDYSRAIKLARSMTDDDPHNYYSHYYLTYLYLISGDLDNAKIQAERAYRMFPTEEYRQRWLAVKKLQEESQSISSNP